LEFHDSFATDDTGSGMNLMDLKTKDWWQEALDVSSRRSQIKKKKKKTFSLVSLVSSVLVEFMFFKNPHL